MGWEFVYVADKWDRGDCAISSLFLCLQCKHLDKCIHGNKAEDEVEKIKD